MNYKKRTILLILIWIILFAVIRIATYYYGYVRSVEMAELTISESLTRVDKSIGDLISNEARIRGYYEQNNSDLGYMVPFLQEHGLEETVPDSEHMEKYAELLGADYIAVLDPDGHTAACYGEPSADSHDMRNITEERMTEWLTSGESLVSEDHDRTLYERDLEDGYKLVYQVNNMLAKSVQNIACSWRAILSETKLANEAYLIVISKKDGTILVHPDESMIGKSYDALGFRSEEDFLSSYREPDADGISYQKSIGELLDKEDSADIFMSQMNIKGRGSGFKEMQGLYVICNMPDNMTDFYMRQQNSLLIIYVLVSLLVLCYILLSFRWMKRHENDVQDEQEDRTGSRFGFRYDRAWNRRLIAFCIIMLMVGTALSLHVELLSNSSMIKIRAAQEKKLEKKIAKENEERRSWLDVWFNDTSVRTATVASYILTRDEGLQNRQTLGELGEAFGDIGIYMFDQEGKTRVTNLNYDHIDLKEKQLPRMSATFLPLLSGVDSNASTPLTERYQVTKKNSGDENSSDSGRNGDVVMLDDALTEAFSAYAGVSIRNSSDLCDGCLGIVLITLDELWEDTAYGFIDGDTYSTALNLVSGDEQGSIVITSSQMMMILTFMLHLAICFALFYCLSVLQRDSGQQTAVVTMTAPQTAGTVTGSTKENEALFYNLFGNHKSRYFHERWNRDLTPIKYRTPEQQLLFVARCVLFALFLWIVFVFLTKGQYLDENSMIRDVVRGGWKKGMNLYAVTAAEMIIISIAALCMALHDLVYFIARFSTPRGETVCHLVYSMITYAAVFVGLYYTLSVFGVHTSTILKGAGIMGLIITFGAQGTIADILSGIFLIFEDVIHVGDFIKVGDTSGVVKNIGVRMTKLQSFGTVISINNADLKALKNMSYSDSRVSCSAKIDNREDLESIREVVDRELPGIEERLKKTGYITTDLRYNGVTAADETGITLEFAVFCKSYRSASVQLMLNEEIISMCQRNGIRLAVSRSLLESSKDE